MGWTLKTSEQQIYATDFLRNTIGGGEVVDLDAAAVAERDDGSEKVDKVVVAVSAHIDDCDEDLNRGVDDGDANADEDDVDDDDDNDTEQDLKYVSASNQLPLLTVNYLLYGSASHYLFPVCRRWPGPTSKISKAPDYFPS